MALEKFHYTTSTKKKLTLPKFGNLPSGILRKVRRERDIEQFFMTFELLFKDDQAQLDILDEMPMAEIVDMMTKWQEDSGVTMGESSESSDS